MNPRPATPAPGRVPFDTLFADPRRLRGDLRLVRKAIRSDTVPLPDRGRLLDKVCGLIRDNDDHATTLGNFRATRLMLSVARALLDVEVHNQKLDRLEFRQEHGLGGRGPIPYGRLFPRRRFDVRDLEGLPLGVDPTCAVALFTLRNGTTFGVRVVRPAGPQLSRWAYLCPCCGRRCRYLYPGCGAVVCADCRPR